MHRLGSLFLALTLGVMSWGCAATLAEKEAQGMRCERRAPTGSNIEAIMCVPVEEEEARRRDDQETMRRLQRKDQMPRPTPSGSN